MLQGACPFLRRRHLPHHLPSSPAYRVTALTVANGPLFFPVETELFRSPVACLALHVHRGLQFAFPYCLSVQAFTGQRFAPATTPSADSQPPVRTLHSARSPRRAVGRASRNKAQCFPTGHAEFTVLVSAQVLGLRIHCSLAQPVSAFYSVLVHRVCRLASGFLPTVLYSAVAFGS